MQPQQITKSFIANHRKMRLGRIKMFEAIFAYHFTSYAKNCIVQ